MKMSIKAQAMLRRLKKSGKALRQEYTLLCRKDKLTDGECRFLSLYPDINKDISDLLAFKPKPANELSLAREVIMQSDKQLANTEKTIMIISGVMAQRRVTSPEIETLKQALQIEIITAMPQAIKSGNILRLLNLYHGISEIDFNTVTSSCDPLHVYLNESDETYRESDPETQKQYRLRICESSRADETETAKKLLDYSKAHSLDLSEVLCPTFHHQTGKASILAACYLSIALSLSLGASLFILEWWVAPMLFLPSLYAAKALVDSALLFKQKPRYLWRLNEASQKLNSGKLAAVFYTILNENADISQISHKLKKLSSTVSGSNIKIVCLIDTSNEQVCETPDDAVALSSINDMITQLNESERGRYVALIRKRSFSKSQEEYVGFGGKRGALLELADFMQNGMHDFRAVFGDAESLVGTRFFAATDEDHIPEFNTVNTLFQIAVHPCNLPRVENGKVVKGYGIIMPSTQPMLESALANGFSKVFALSVNRQDVFNELFGEATFDGMGLINTELYLQSKNALPAEKLPRPYVLEGEWLKCVKAYDAKLYNTFPDTPQRYYREKAGKVQSALYDLPYAFKKQTSLVSRIKLISKFIGALVPVSVMINLYSAFWLYPPAAELAAIIGLVMWLLPCLSASIKQAIYCIVMLPTLAQKSFWALVTAFIRRLIGKRLFSANLAPTDPLSFYMLPMLLSLALFRSPGYTIRLLALFFVLMPALLAFSEHESFKKEYKLSFKETKDLTQYVTDSWRFYSEYVTEADNNLPPKSVQFSPVFRISHQTGPKEIGLYLASCLAAYDLKLISAQAMAARIEKCVDSLDKLVKHSGCLYESYNTIDLVPASDVILSEDMGVYISSLISLCEGMRKLGKVYDKAEILIERLERIIDAVDLSIFYDKVSGLMCKSFNPLTQTQSAQHHEQIMSVDRLCSFYAIAKRNVPKSHWLKLKRQTLKCGFYSGLGSPTGSMEEYFLPEVFLQSPRGSVFHESLKYALFVHKKLGLAKGFPFGLSQNGVHLFNSQLDYRTQKLGAPKAAISQTVLQEYSVSPHSSMLALNFDAHECIENLLKLKKAGCYGNFGFFEAVDYTREESESVVKYLTSCHVGEIILSGVNALNKGIMQRRMAKNRHVLGALELLEERVLPSCKQLRKPKALTCNRLASETFFDISPSAPRIKLLNNCGYSLMLTDSGTSIAVRKGLCIYDKTVDPSFNKRGVFVGVKTPSGVMMLDSPEGLTCKFTDQGVIYEKTDNKIQASLSVCLHTETSCEIRQFTLKSLSDEDIDATLLIYLEPKLLKPNEQDTDRKRLSLRLERDDRQKVITISRADFNCSQCTAIGFYEDIAMQPSFDRDSVFFGCDDLAQVFENADLIAPSLVCEPEPCVFIKAKVRLKAGAQLKANMFILCADSFDELSANISNLRGHALTLHTQTSTKAVVLAQLILPHLLFNSKKSDVSLTSLSSELMPNVPLMVLKLNNKNDDEKLSSFLEAYKVIREAGIAVQMAVLFNDGGKPEREHYAKLLNAAKKCDVLDFIYAKGGIIPIDEYAFGNETAESLCSLACYTAPDEIVGTAPYRKAHKRIEIEKVLPDITEINEKVAFGGFTDEQYIINERPHVKWRHVLSNPVFGVVTENNSLGITSIGDFKEKLVLELNGRYFDIINGATACFSPHTAVYKAVKDGFKSEVTVRISQKGMCKRCDVKIVTDQKCRLAYVFEAQDGAIEQSEKTVIIKLNGKLAGISANKLPKAVFEKEAFFSGEWNKETSPSGGFCAIVTELSGAEEVNFCLSFGTSEKSVTKMPSLFCPADEVKPSCKQERQLLWAKYQLINGRIYLGNGHGRFRFDNLLQDAYALARTEPDRCKVEILRCAYRQFSDGDACAEWQKGEKAGCKRTNESLEHLWLPLAVCEYITQTDDIKFLDVGVQYCDSPPQKESVYEHCRRAINISLDKKGPHGLIADSTERESVWLSEFSIIVLERFCQISRRKGDNIYSAQLMYHAKSLREAIVAFCKDSSQYIGGYLPTGETWGSTKNDACKISLLPQVLAQFAVIDEHFDKYALLQAYDMLCDVKRGVTKLFSPPFDPDSETVPAEAKYLPQGIKQNGGQITAAAIWLATALKRAGFKSEANGIVKSLTPEERAKTIGYKQEPYYICGEIYTNKNCYGRGADPIFNSAAAWYYRYLTEQGESE